MVRNVYSSALLLLVVAGGTVAARAGEAETDARVAALEREVAALKSQSHMVAGEFQAEPSPATFGAGAELTLLRPEIGSLALRNLIQDRFQVTPDYDLNAACRVWIDRDWGNGLGWRAAYWTFQDAARLEFPPQFQNAALSSALNLYTVDLELTRQARFACWDVSTSIGARIGGVDIEEALTTDLNSGSINEHFTGAGLTFSLGTQQPLGQSHWSLCSGFRGSLLYGATSFNMSADVNEAIQFHGGLAGTVADQTVAIWEIQAGLQYERCTQIGILFGRAAVEAQLWELPPVIAGLGDKSLGLLGPTFAVGLRR